MTLHAVFDVRNRFENHATGRWKSNIFRQVVRMSLAILAGGSAAYIPTTIWNNVEALYSNIGLISFFVVAGPLLVIVIRANSES